MPETSTTARSPLARLRAGLDFLWIEEKVVWSALLLTVLLFEIVGLPFSVRLVGIGYALFLGRIAAVVVLIVAAHRLWMRYLRGVTYDAFTIADVWHFLRSLGFYIVALTTYTNLKTHTLLLNSRVYDGLFETLDRWMFLGNSPTEMALSMTGRPALTALMDTSYTYAWVPLAIVFGVAFSQGGGQGFRRLARVVSLNYLVGALLYVALPAVGPAFANRELYEGLRQSRSFMIQNSLIQVHNMTINDPRNFLVPAFMGIAAFPSLHLSHIYLPLLVAWKRARPLFYLFLMPFLAVALSTVYFGWHWVIDIPAGMASIHLCLWLARRMEAREEVARGRRAAMATPGALGARSLGHGLSQWPVPAIAGALHFAALIIALVLVTPTIELSWGARAALLFYLCFLVLFEVCLVIGLNGLLEGLARGARAERILDGLKSAALAAILTLMTASLIKLGTTGSHLARLDLWFLSRNLSQIMGESLGAELGMMVLLLLLGALLTIVLYRAFRWVRRHPVEMPTRSFLLLVVLASLGLAYSASRYPDVATAARAVAPEINWTLGDRVATPVPPQAGDEDFVLNGPPVVAYSPDLPAERPNLVLIMLESVPWNVMEAPEAARAIPNLLGLAGESLTFRRAYAPSVHSDYAQMAILSSLYPRKYPQHDFYERLDYPRTLLWDAMTPAGWNFTMFSCQNESWGNMIRYLQTSGLGLMRHSTDWPSAPRRGRGRESKVYEATVVGAWQDWLETARAPWATYLNFQATHFPYETPVNAARPFTPDEIDFPASFVHYPQDKTDVVRNRYLNALHYTDRYVGEVIRILKERGEWDRTVLAVVSDHGEAFYEHGQPTHGTHLFEEQVRSLMMVRIPSTASRTIDEPVSLMDLVPSLVRSLGLPDHGNFQGRSDIFDPAYSGRGRALFFTIQGMTDEDGMLRDDWKYTVNWRTGVRQLYHLASDPGELRNLAKDEVGRADLMHEQLMQFLARQLAYYDRQGWREGRYAAALP